MDLGLAGKIAVVTGADSGIAKATAEQLLREGAKVAIIDKTGEPLQKAAKDLETFGEVIAVQADLTQLAQVDAAQRHILNRFGTVHVLVNAAGITGATGDFLEISDQQWHNTIETDLMAAVRVCRAFIPSMRQAGWGRIVLTGLRKKS